LLTLLFLDAAAVHRRPVGLERPTVRPVGRMADERAKKPQDTNAFLPLASFEKALARKKKQ
jgi:hypothetical protein